MPNLMIKWQLYNIFDNFSVFLGVHSLIVQPPPSLPQVLGNFSKPLSYILLFYYFNSDLL